jgi:hypothetical protein
VGGKSDGFSRAILVASGVAICMGLASCVYPFDDQAGGGATYTMYQSGYRLQSLPYGYRSETISGNPYYYDNGNYYRRDSSGYVVVEAPRDSRYYDDYRRVRQNREVNSSRNQQIYDRNNPQVRHGEVITRLPSGHRVVTHRGQNYYQVNDRYYIQDRAGYVRVANPY